MRLLLDILNQDAERLPRRLRALGVRFPHLRGGAGRPAGRHRAVLGQRHRRYRHPRGAEGDLRTVYAIGVTLPARWVMLDKTVATLAGVVLEVSPDFNVFEAARPYAVRLATDRYRPDRIAGRVPRRRPLRRGHARLPLPGLELLDEFREGDVEIRIRPEGFDEAVDKLEASANRVVSPSSPRPVPRLRRDRGLRPLRRRRRPVAAGARGSSRRSCSWCGSASASSARAAGELARRTGGLRRGRRAGGRPRPARAGRLGARPPRPGDPAAARAFLASDGPPAPPEDLAGTGGRRPPGAGGPARGAHRGARRLRLRWGLLDRRAAHRPAGPRRGGRGVPPEPLRRRLRGRGLHGRAAGGRRGAGARLRRLRDVGGGGADPRRGARAGSDRARPPPGGRRRPRDHRQPGAGPAGRGPAGGRRGRPHGRGRSRRVDGGAPPPTPTRGSTSSRSPRVADAVPLIGDNRRRVAQGLRAIRERPGRHRGPVRRGRDRAADGQRPHSASPWRRASTPPGAWRMPTGPSSCCSRRTGRPPTHRGGALGAERPPSRGGAGDPRGGRRAARRSRPRSARPGRSW